MCTSPKHAFIPKQPDQDGKRAILFKAPSAKSILKFDKIEVPCGKCIACHSLRSVKQAVQLACELKMTAGNSYFITLTYDDQNLPDDFSVHKEHLQKFIRDLRYYLKTNKIKGKIRYSSRREYGGQFNRPHYHLAIFDLNINDLELYSQQPSSGGTYNVYESPCLTKIWANGTIKLIELSYENCLYIAQHHFAEKADQQLPPHKQRVRHPVTGKIIIEREPEGSTHSSRPGIGHTFFEKYFTDLFPHDSVIIKSRESSVPNYFLKLLQKENPELFEQIKIQRREKLKTKTLKENRYQDNYNRTTLTTGHIKGRTTLRAGKYYKKEMNQI